MPPPERLTLTVEETARLIGVSRGACYSAVRAGQSPSIKVGRRVLVPRHKLEALLGIENEDGPATADEAAEDQHPNHGLEVEGGP
jgi:excisionase family DNA binding protein